MPHIVMEYSANLKQPIQESNLLKILHKEIIDSCLFSPEAIKARSISYDDYILPDGTNNFIHLTISILTGRSTEQRKEISQSCLKLMQKHIPNGEKLSVNIHEMQADTYSK